MMWIIYTTCADKHDMVSRLIQSHYAGHHNAGECSPFLDQ